MTEHILLEPRSTGIQTLSILRSLGARVALDDYGTGFSNLQTLEQLQPHVIKVDGSFTDPGGAAGPAWPRVHRRRKHLPESLTPSSRLKGVETEAHLHVVEDLGSRWARGYHLDLVMPPGGTCRYGRRQGNRGLPMTSPSDAPRTPPRPGTLLREYVRALHSGDVNSVRHIMLVLADRFHGRSSDPDLIAPGQHEIGQAWGGSKLTVAEEHEATAIAEEALVLLLDSSSDAADGQLGDVVPLRGPRRVALGAARMVAAVWRHLGWNVHLLIALRTGPGDIRNFGRFSGGVVGCDVCHVCQPLRRVARDLGPSRVGCWVIAGGRGFGPPARGK